MAARRPAAPIAVLSAVLATQAAPAPAAERVPGLREIQRLPMPYFGSLVVPGAGAGRAPGAVLQVGQRCHVRALVPAARGRLRRAREPGRDRRVQGHERAVGAAAGDVDGDGRSDLVVATSRRSVDGSSGSEVVVFRQHGARAFAVTSTFFETADVYRMLLLDVDGDGRLDLLTASGSGGVVLRQGRGDYDPRNLEAFDPDGDRSAESLLVADSRTLRVFGVGPPGRRSAPGLPSPVAAIVAADRSAHVVLACTRGIGPCRGVVGLRAGGRRLGSQPFDVAAGGRADVRIELRRLPAAPRAVVRVRGISGRRSRAVTARPATAAERRRACRAGAPVVRRGASRLLSPPDGGDPVGCLDRIGAWVPLGAEVIRGPLAVGGRCAVFHHDICDDSCLARIGLTDLVRGRLVGGIDVFPARCGSAGRRSAAAGRPVRAHGAPDRGRRRPGRPPARRAPARPGPGPGPARAGSVLSRRVSGRGSGRRSSRPRSARPRRAGTPC